MSRATLADARAELLALLAPDGAPAVDGVVKVHDYEPRAGDRAKPIAMTVATAGMTWDHWLLALRIYVDADTDVIAAQRTLDGLMVEVDDMLTAGFGPSRWVVEYDPELVCFVATDSIEVGREDY